MSSGHHHRATLKQSNKSFKSRHASKGSLKTAAKGKPASASPASSHAHKNVTAASKKARLNANAQKRDLKRRAVTHDLKFFSTSSGGSSVPRIISVVPLLPSLSPKRFLENLLPTLGLPMDELESVKSSLGQVGSWMIRAPKFKTNLQVNLLPPLDVYATLDAALVSDYVVLLESSTDEVQLEGEAVLRCLQGQVGGVDIITAVQAPLDNPITPATKNLIHKSLLSFTKYFYPAVAKIYSSDTPSEAHILARSLCEAVPTGSKEDTRAYIVAEGSGSVNWSPSTSEDVGTLEVTGTIRGGKLSANRLVHIPGQGDFQVEAITHAPPSSLTLAAKPHHAAMAVDESSAPLSIPGEVADDLTATNEPDMMANEQTWPTEEEMQGAVAGPSEVKRTKRVPKGTSAYQAAWIFDDDDGEEEEDDDMMDEDEALEGGEEIDGEEGDEEETEEIELDSRRGETHRDLDPEQEEREYEAYLRQREKAALEDQQFPDEIDTPRHVSARTRFQRYRGLKSFRTSPWDPYENLPLDYAKIFQFENFGATGRRIEKEAKMDGIEAGKRVVLRIKNVPRSVLDRDQRLPFIVHGLLQHEHKQSVLHFVVQRNTEYDAPIKAKEPLVICVGPRRYTIRPLFSQHVRGGGKGVNNVHKSEKFLRDGTATVLTTFGPVCFGKHPCILLKNEHNGIPSLVAMGSSLPPDPTRIIAKRIVLTGHPLKIHKKTATLRYMFFEREDVEYFRTVELHTKYGRIGHISEPLGTHGYFKAHFDGPIGQMDTICMSLYKRQFPKWSEDFKPDYKVHASSVPEEEDEMEIE